MVPIGKIIHPKCAIDEKAIINLIEEIFSWDNTPIIKVKVANREINAIKGIFIIIKIGIDFCHERRIKILFQVKALAILITQKCKGAKAILNLITRIIKGKILNRFSEVIIFLYEEE